MAALFGIHVGNTSACLAIWKDEDRLEVIANDAGDRVTPTVVQWTPSASVVGRAAQVEHFKNDSNTIIRNKQLLNDTITDSELKHLKSQVNYKIIKSGTCIKYELLFDGKQHHISPRDVLLLIMKKIYAIAKTAVGGNKELNAVITVPLHFSWGATEVVKEVVKKVGFNVLQVIDEASSAALGAGLGCLVEEPPYHCLVYRIGGATLDATVLLVQDGMFSILSTIHRYDLGGELFTEKLAEFLTGEFKRQYKTAELTERSKYKLRSAAENVKQILSIQNLAQCSAESVGGGYDLNCSVSRARFENLIAEYLPDVITAVKEVLQMTNLSVDQIKKVRLIAPWPNTYNFSKALAEDIIKEEQGLPIGIFRPSIVIGSSEEPVPGWINNLYGPAGVVAGVGAGVLRVLKVNTELRADLVPVDMTVNALICSAWDIHNIYSEREKAKNYPADKTSTSNIIQRWGSRIPIYNFVTSDSNSVKWKDYLYYSMLHGKKIPPLNSLWYITLTTTKLDIIYKALMVLYHILPAVILDTFLALAGRKTRMLRTYKKIHKFSKVISYFTMKEWVFERHNLEKLWHALNETDKKLFNFDMGKIDWNSYFQNTMSGMRIYLFKDEESTIPMARRKMLFLFLCHRLLQLTAVTLTLLLTFHVYKGLM